MAAALAALLLALATDGCTVEHYQILPDWTDDEATDGGAETTTDVLGEDPDVPGESDDGDVHEEDEDDGPPACREPSEDGDLPCDPGLVCCELDPTDLCLDLSADPAHCGACDRVCEPDQECRSGTCLDG